MHVVWVLVAKIALGNVAGVAVNPMDTTQITPLYSMSPQYRTVVAGIYDSESACNGDKFAAMQKYRTRYLECLQQQVGQ